MIIYSIGIFARNIRRTEQTLRNWDNSTNLNRFMFLLVYTLFFVRTTESFLKLLLSNVINMENLIPIITVFSCRLQYKRENKVKKMIKEFLR